MPPIFYNPFYHLKVLFIAKTQNEEYISCEKNKSLTSKRLRDTGTMKGGGVSFAPPNIGKNRSKKGLNYYPPLDFQIFLWPWACMSATSCSTLNSAAWRKEYAK